MGILARKKPLALLRVRSVGDGRNFQYVFIDESGNLGSEGSGFFYMAGIVTEDPERLATTVLSSPSRTVNRKGYIKPVGKWSKPGEAEVKWNNTHSEIHSSIMSSMESQGALVYAIAMPRRALEFKIGDETLYRQTFKELVELIAREGPGGIYRFRLDESHRFDRRAFEEIIRTTMGNCDKTPSEKILVSAADSDLMPCLQAADIAVGEIRRMHTNGEKLPGNCRLKVLPKPVPMHAWDGGA